MSDSDKLWVSLLSFSIGLIISAIGYPLLFVRGRSEAIIQCMDELQFEEVFVREKERAKKIYDNDFHKVHKHMVMWVNNRLEIKK